MRHLFTDTYPPAILLVFLAYVLLSKIPRKGAFLARALVALVIAVFLAHVNRIFGLWPAHLLFPSGHTTFCLGVAFSLALLRPWTLLITLPLIVLLGFSMVTLHYHSTFDILGAVPLALVVYGTIHWLWPLAASPPLDRARVSL